MAELTEALVAARLWRKYGIGQWAVANTHYYAFESDVLILRTTGTVVEYEIKLSVQDWRAGLKKRQCLDGSDKRRRVNKIHPAQKEISRHEYLTRGYGANMFYYAAPQDVLDRVEVPEWAGIIQVRPWQNSQCYSKLIKKAPKLHSKKASPELKEKILTSCYYKYWKHYAEDDIELLKNIPRRTI